MPRLEWRELHLRLFAAHAARVAGLAGNDETVCESFSSSSVQALEAMAHELADVNRTVSANGKGGEGKGRIGAGSNAVGSKG